MMIYFPELHDKFDMFHQELINQNADFARKLR